MKYRNQLAFITIDAILSVAAVFLATLLRFEGSIPPDYRMHLLRYYPIAAVTIVIAGMAFGTYQSVLQYIGFADAFRQIAASFFSAAVFLFIKYAGIYTVSGSISVIYFGILLIATTGIRLIPRFRHWLRTRNQPNARRAMIIGAGATGAMLIKRLEENIGEALYPVVAVDDDPAKLHMRVAGIMVAARLNQIPRIAKSFNIEEAILAIPSLEPARIAEIHQKCASCGIKLRLFRSAVDMESYFAGDHKALRQIAIEDLLFRDSIQLDRDLIFRCLQGKVVLVTGGAGSIGAEICRQALANGCGKLVIFDIDENGLFSINEELSRLYPAGKYELCLGSIQDEECLAYVFRTHQPKLVFHAAAHKHVPMTEANPFEAVKNNIIGTENVLEACRRFGAERFILISTDKAVNPSSVMGATKRIAELLTQSAGLQAAQEVQEANRQASRESDVQNLGPGGYEPHGHSLAPNTDAKAPADDAMQDEDAMQAADIAQANETAQAQACDAVQTSLESDAPALPGCRMAAVRFGNVLASTGSVIPTFQKQIEAGGPVTVTHQDMERYFITIPEAVSLVMIAGTLAEGGEIFILDMGKPVKIYDLAKELIRLSGFEPERDIRIEFIGPRPGEKMTEEIILDSEKASRTAQEKLFVMMSKSFDADAFQSRLAQIKEAGRAYDPDRLKEILMETAEAFS